MKFFKVNILIMLLLLMLSAQNLMALSAQTIKVVKISPKDERAVIKIEKNALQVIKAGDSIGNNLKVIEITEGRIVLEEINDTGRETIIIRVEDGKHRVEKIKMVDEKRPTLLVPKNIEEIGSEVKGQNAPENRQKKRN